MATRGPRRWSWLPDTAGVSWVVAAAVGTMVPALVRGTALGPYDLLGVSGLLQQAGTHVHSLQVSDQIEEFIPWTALAWHQVHAGHLPLWDPYSALGLPLAFNWQSGAFSVPALVGYLVPLRLAYTAQVLVTLVLAGTGAYACARALRIGVIGAAMAGTVYELSGPVMNWLGWPNASVMSWAGWLVAAVVMVVRGRRRRRWIVATALVVAAAVYAGQPEMLFLLGLAVVVFAAVFVAMRSRPQAGGAAALGPARDVAVAGAAGLALGAPLLLPGLPLLAGSTRGAGDFPRAFPLHDLTHVLLQGFDARPVGLPIDPIESAAYVGVIGLVLAVAGAAVRRRDPAVVAMAVVAVTAAALAFVPFAVLLADGVPGGHSVHWRYEILPLAFAVAVLAGAGTDAVVRSPSTREVGRWIGGASAAVALALVLVWSLGRGSEPPAQGAHRAASFVWPTVLTAVALVAAAALVVGGRRRAPRRGDGTRAVRMAVALVLTAGEAAFLAAVGAQLWSSTPGALPRTPAATALTRTVGTALVGFAVRACDGLDALGFVPDVNVAYGVREFAAYDPIVPLAYRRSLAVADRHPVRVDPGGICPAVTGAAVARLYGVGYVLGRPGGPVPSGTDPVATIGGERLFRVPDAAAATTTPLVGARLPSPRARGTPVAVAHPDPATWRLVVDVARPAVLRLRLTGVPGWHATVDGRTLRLSAFLGVMLQARLPAGRHTVVLTYWPTTFTVGLVLAAATAVALVVAPAAWRAGIRRTQWAGDGPRGTTAPGCSADPGRRA